MGLVDDWLVLGRVGSQGHADALGALLQLSPETVCGELCPHAATGKAKVRGAEPYTLI
jgi:hypothetical protein